MAPNSRLLADICTAPLRAQHGAANRERWESLESQICMNAKRLFCAVRCLLPAGTIFLSGCAGLGVAVLGNDEAVVSNPRIGVKGALRPESGATPWIKSADLMKFWGPPDRMEQAGRGVQLWRYNFGIRWNGIVPVIAVVPIPLIAPMGSDYVELRIENDFVVSARAMEHHVNAMYGCAVVIGPHVGAGCKFGALSEQEKGQKTFLKSTDTYKISVVNGTDGPVTITYTNRTRSNDKNHSSEDHFVLVSGETRHFLSQGGREELAAVMSDGRKIVRRPVPDILRRRDTDSSLFYLIASNRILLMPSEYWNNWEGHLEEIIDSQRAR